MSRRTTTGSTLVVHVLAEKMDVIFEPEALHHVVHSIEAAQDGALASGRANKAGYRALRDRDSAVAHREKIVIE
jgi:hypothetical protein